MNYILKIIKNKHFLFVLTVCLTCCGMLSCNKKDDTQDDIQDDVYLKKFTDEELKTWKEDNKKSENEYTLNGGYYIHFNGINYPVVFESGKIVSFDNAPDELYFIEILAFYTDAKLKNRCAFLARFTKYLRIFSSDRTYYEGYILDGKRPKNGTVLYIDETKEKMFCLSSGETFGPDDIIDVVSYNNRVKFIAFDNNGNLLDECNTARKLYYFIKEKISEIVGEIEFKNKTEYTCIPYPNSFEEYISLYIFENNFPFNTTTFDNDEWEKDYDKYSIYNKINIFYGGLLDYVVFDVFYNDNLPHSYYRVIVNSDGINYLEEDINKYTDVIRSRTGQIESYVYNEKTYTCFYGTIKEFDDFLMQNYYIDEDTKQGIASFSLENGENYMSQYFDYNNVIFSYSAYTSNTLYAVWDYYKTVTLHYDEDKEMYICPNKEYVLPEAEKPGYEFVGWYASSDFKGEKVESLSYDDEYKELFAKFEKVDYYTLTFESYDNYTFDEIKYSYGDELALPTLTKTFYVFAGWCTDSECKTEPFKSINKEFFGSYHLYPCFKPLEYTITLILDDSVENVKIKYGEEYVLPIENVKEKFIGYFDSNNVQYTNEKGESLFAFTDAADILLFAKYETEETNE